MNTQTLQVKEFWWDENGNLHIIRADNGEEEIYTNASIVSQDTNMSGSNIVRQSCTFVGTVVEEQMDKEPRNYKVVLKQLHDLHQVRREMCYYSIYHGSYEAMAIDLNRELFELTGRNYIDFTIKELESL